MFQNDTSIVSVLRFTAVTGSQQDTYRCNATSTAGSSYDLTEVSLSGKCVHLCVCVCLCVCLHVLCVRTYVCMHLQMY